MLYLLLIIVLGAAGFAAYLWSQGQLGSGAMFGTAHRRRTEVVEVTTIKGGRKLMLIRRDDVEHLVMTGGPVDVVIETGIIARSLAEIQAERQNGRADPLFMPPEDAIRTPQAQRMAAS